MGKFLKVYAVGATIFGVIGWVAYSYLDGLYDNKDSALLDKEGFDELFHRAYAVGANAGYAIGYSDHKLGLSYNSYHARGEKWDTED